MKYIIMITLAYLFFQCSERTDMQENEKRITVDLEERAETSVFDLTDSSEAGGI